MDTIETKYRAPLHEGTSRCISANPTVKGFGCVAWLSVSEACGDDDYIETTAWLNAEELDTLIDGLIAIREGRG